VLTRAPAVAAKVHDHVSSLAHVVRVAPPSRWRVLQPGDVAAYGLVPGISSAYRAPPATAAW